MRVRDLMSSHVVTVKSGNSIRRAAQIMLEHDVSGLPVLDDDGQLVGIITESDLLRRVESALTTAFGKQHDATLPEQVHIAFMKKHGWSVGDTMTTGVITALEDSPVGEIAALMIGHRIKCVPVVRLGKLVGIISRNDILRAIVSAEPDNIAPGDAALQRSIVTRFNESLGEAGAHLTVAVLDCVVHLGGKVSSEAERGMARVIAESVHGVAGVIDHLEIGPPSQEEVKS